ncbi:MAG: VWA domain-containing protein, partial [Proteobacteria bacterium]
AKYSSKPIDVLNIKTDESALIESADLDESKGPPPKIEIIVDSSGSMGQLLGPFRTRMYFMKKMLTRYMTDQYKEKAQTGLRVYGSKRVGDCSDNELAVPFGEKSLVGIETRVAKLEPVGKTPLFKAVKAAAQDLKSYKGPKAIIVFTDGEDTCGGNPCVDGKEARRDALLDTQIFVVAIGYKPNADDLKKISCMGDTQTAESEGDLFSAMGGIHSKIFSKQINLKVVSPDPTAEVQLFHQVDGAWTYLRSFTAAFGATVPPGKYQVVVNLAPPYKFEEVVIPPKKVVTLTVKGAGFFQVEFMPGHPVLDVEMLDKNMKTVEKFKNDEQKKIPTGKYAVKISKAPFFEKLVPKFDIYPNGTFKYKLTAAGAVQVKSKEMVGLYVYDRRNNILGNYLTNFPFVLAAGEYKIHVNDQCTFPEVAIKDDPKIQMLVCGKKYPAPSKVEVGTDGKVLKPKKKTQLKGQKRERQ